MKELKFSFQQTIPVMLGYIFLGIAFGLFADANGYGLLWSFAASTFVYAGSMQFVLISLFTGGASFLMAALMTLFVNGRHIFYGISFIEKYRSMGWRYPYMIFSLTDETYSVLISAKPGEELDEKRVLFLISILDQLYWITGSVIGAVAGQFITFDTTGIDFAMTSLFVVIVVNQWLESKHHMPALISLLVSVVCLLLLGPDSFLLPALFIICGIMLGGRKVWAEN